MSWTNDELKAYMLLYAANADYKESNLERNIIADRVDRHTFQRIHDEFDKDNDYQSVQKISNCIKQLNYSNEDIDLLYAEMKLMFFADGQYVQLEQNLFLFLKKILKY